MLRMFVIAGGFLAITLALLALQPGTAPQDAFLHASEPSELDRAPSPVVNQVQVSRAENDLDLVSTLGTTSAASLNASRLDSAIAQLSAPAPEAGNADMATLSASVLSGLGKSAPTAPATGEPDALRDMTADVLASLTAARTPSLIPQAQKLEALIAQALHQGQPDAYLDAILNEAAIAGQITVPDALLTDTGKLDTATLLATLVTKSKPANDAAIPPNTFADGAGVEVRVVQRAGQTIHYSFYTVQSGDSLGAIAHKFYGDARLYKTIYEANRTFLSTPNAIRPGQRLTIPNPGTS